MRSCRMREIRKFQQSNEEWKDWPIFLAGGAFPRPLFLRALLISPRADLNTQPNELTYRLSVSPSSPLPANLLTNFERSRVVHHTVSKLHDPSFEPPAPPEAEPQEGDTPAAEPGFDDPTAPLLTPIRNSRPGNFEDDGIADLDTLRSLFTSVAGEGGSGTRSAYGEAYGLCEGEARRWYCDRKPEVQAGNGWRVEETEEEKAKRRVGEWEERVKRGDFEPKFSNCAFPLLVLCQNTLLTRGPPFRAVTPLWRCTLEWVPSFTSSPPHPVVLFACRNLPPHPAPSFYPPPLSCAPSISASNPLPPSQLHFPPPSFRHLVRSSTSAMALPPQDARLQRDLRARTTAEGRRAE